MTLYKRLRVWMGLRLTLFQVILILFIWTLLSYYSLQKVLISTDQLYVHPLRPLALPPTATKAHCRMFSCFDYSRCSLTSGFPVYLYDPDIYAPLIEAEVGSFLKTSLRQTLSHNPHITSNPREACLFIVIVGEAFPLKINISNAESYRLNETALKSLPYWRGDGRNHLLLNLARVGVGSGDAFAETSIGRAMVAQSTFTHDRFRPGFDIVTPPALGPPDGDVWDKCAPLAPARRSYFLSFQGSQTPLNGTEADEERALVERLKSLSNSSIDTFLLQFECDPPVEKRTVPSVGDWLLCGTENLRRAVLENSTFTLLLAPAEPRLATTAILQSRLYEALRSGAIPVLIGGDRLRLPFEEVLDWRRAVIAVPRARIPELDFLLRTFEDADLLLLRRQGRLLWDRYLSSVQALVDSLVGVIRGRLGLPAKPAQPELSAEIEMTLDPLNVTYPSPAYQRNYSIGIDAYAAWNQWADPFALYPQLPWDPAVTSESVGSAEKKFSKPLGGDRPTEQFTVLILAYNRETVLNATITGLFGLPHLNKVIIVWNSPSAPPSVSSWPDAGVPIAVIRTKRNSLNNRFLPYQLIETEAVLSLDDDSNASHYEIQLAFRVWREHKDRIVGIPGRYHQWDAKKGLIYYHSPSCELSMVLTGAAFIHRYYLWAYWRVLPAAVREHVDKVMNCEDFAMNFLVAHITRKPPIKVTSKHSFFCRECKDGGLASKKTHYGDRNKCLQLFSQIMGYMPLLSTQFKAEPVLIDQKNKTKCFH